MLGFDYHKDKEAFALAEIEALTGFHAVVRGAFIVVDTVYIPRYNRLAFTKAIYDLSHGKHLIIDLNKLHQFEKRRAHLLPAGHPGMTHPRLARAMVNLSKAAVVVADPFCGGGGILIEAGLCGLRCVGSDSDVQMVGRATENCLAYGVQANITQQDARTYKGAYDIIVTDFPYGKTTKVDGDVVALYRDFLLHAAQQGVMRMVVGFPNTVDAVHIAQGCGFVVEKKFTYYLHKSLRKLILVIVPRPVLR